MLVEVEVPNMPSGSAAAYRKETVTSGDYPIVSVAAFICLDKKQHTKKQARIVLGAVGVTPIYAQEASQAMIGKTVTAKLAAEAGAIARGEAQPVSDILGSEDHKRQLVAVLIGVSQPVEASVSQLP